MTGEAKVTATQGLPMRMELSHHPNPDIHGYRSKPSESGRKRIVLVSSYEHASQIYRMYIDHNGLGAGNTSFAPIFNDAGVQIAHVSYNGRVWKGSIRIPFAEREEILLRD